MTKETISFCEPCLEYQLTRRAKGNDRVIVKLPAYSKKHDHQNKIREFFAMSNVVNIAFDNDEEFGEIGETLVLTFSLGFGASVRL